MLKGSTTLTFFDLRLDNVLHYNFLKEYVNKSIHFWWKVYVLKFNPWENHEQPLFDPKFVLSMPLLILRDSKLPQIGEHQQILA